MKKFLVISLVHNKKQFLSDCIMSVVNQTMPKDKFIHLLIDNGSTDGAQVVCEVFSKKYSHIRLVKMDQNFGQMPAYNWALREWIPKEMPEAEIMCHVDADDLLSNIALDEVEKKFRIGVDIGQTYSDFNIISASGITKIKAHPKAKQVDPKIELTDRGQAILRLFECRFNSIGHLRAMRISSLNDIGGFDESYKYATDVNMACKMLSSKYKVAKIPKILYHWREHGKDQVQGSVSGEQTKCWKELISFYSEKWKKEGKF